MIQDANVLPKVQETIDELGLTKEQIERYIEEADSAQEKIFTKYKEATEGKYVKHRWFWELLQNAVDTIENGTPINIKLHINKNGDNYDVIFEHDGGYFKPAVEWNKRHEFKNFILAKSGKKINDDKVGKFGTGFLSTHCLSDSIKIEGICIEEDESKVYREINIDRKEFSSEDEDDIQVRTLKIIKSLVEYESLAKPIDGKEDSAKFTYTVSLNNIEKVEDGIKEMLFSIPYVLTFSKKIKNISIYRNDILDIEIKPLNEPEEFHGLELHKTEIKNNGEIPKTVCIASLSKDEITVAWKIEKNSDQINFRNERKEYKELFKAEMNSLFCQYPLIGSQDFIFPLIVNSQNFRPEEKRHGINLKESNTTNKDIISTSLRLFQQYLDIASKKGTCIYNIIETNYEKDKRDWIDYIWYGEKIIEARKAILKAKIIDISDNLEECKSIINEYGKQNIIFPRQVYNEELDKEIEDQYDKEFYEFCRKLYPQQVPIDSDIESWINALWESDKTSIINTNDLIKKIALQKDVKTLATLVRGQSEIEEEDNYENELKWLKDFISFVKDKLREPSLFNYSTRPNGIQTLHPIIPSRSLNFKILNDLNQDIGYNGDQIIDDDLLNIHNIFDPDKKLKDRLIHKKFLDIFSFEKHKQLTEKSVAEDISSKVEDELNQHDKLLLDLESDPKNSVKAESRNKIESKLSTLQNWIAKHNKEREYFKEHLKRKILQAIIDEKKTESLTELLELDREGKHSLEKQSKIMKDPDLDRKLEEGEKVLEEIRENDERFERLRKIGKFFENYMLKILSLEVGEENILHQDGKQDFIIYENIYLELKTTQGSLSVKLNPEQAKEASKRGKKYFLAVFNYNKNYKDVTIDEFKNGLLFTNKLHEVVKNIVKNMDSNESPLNESVYLSFPRIYNSFRGMKPYKYNVQRSAWGTISFNDFMSEVKKMRVEA